MTVSADGGGVHEPDVEEHGCGGQRLRDRDLDRLPRPDQRGPGGRERPAGLAVLEAHRTADGVEEIVAVDAEALGRRRLELADEAVRRVVHVVMIVDQATVSSSSARNRRLDGGVVINGRSSSPDRAKASDAR